MTGKKIYAKKKQKNKFTGEFKDKYCDKFWK